MLLHQVSKHWRPKYINSSKSSISKKQITQSKNVCVCISHSVVSDSLIPCPWNSPGKNTGVCCHSLLQGIFPTQKSNLGLPHCRQILYPLSHQALVVKNPPASAGEVADTGSVPGSGRSPGGGNSNPLQSSCLENPRDRGA